MDKKNITKVYGELKKKEVIIHDDPSDKPEDNPFKKMEKEYKFVGDCLEMETEVSLCEEKVHGKEFHLSVKFGMEVNTNQLKELLKFEKGLKDNQYWEIRLRKRK